MWPGTQLLTGFLDLLLKHAFFFFKLEDGCFTMLCYFLLYNV